MSRTFTLKLNDFDADMLSEISERDGRSKNDLIVEALREVLSRRLDDKIPWLTSEEFNSCMDIISKPETNKDILERREKLMQIKPVWED